MWSRGERLQEGRCSAACTLQERQPAAWAQHLPSCTAPRGPGVALTRPEVAPTINCTQRRCCTQELHLASACNVYRCTWHLVAPTKRLHQLSAAPGGCTAAMNCSYPMQCIALHLARVSLLELHLVSSTQRVLLKQGFHQPRANSKLQ